MFAYLRGRLHELTYGIFDVRGHSPMFVRFAVKFVVNIKWSLTAADEGGLRKPGLPLEL